MKPTCGPSARRRPTSRTDRPRSTLNGRALRALPESSGHRIGGAGSRPPVCRIEALPFRLWRRGRQSALAETCALFGRTDTQADLDRILEVAWRSPSSNNEQRWDIVVCTDKAQLDQLSRAWTWAGHIAGAAAAIVLLSTHAEAGDFVEFDLGQVTMIILVEQQTLGSAPAIPPSAIRTSFVKCSGVLPTAKPSP